jgi:integrase
MKIKPERNNQLQQDGWRIDVTVDGKRHRDWFPTKAEAEEAVAQLTLAKRARKLGLPLPKPKKVVTLAQLLTARERELGQRSSAKANLRECVAFAATLPPSITLDEIQPHHIAAYIKTLRQRQLNGNTFNLALSRLNSLFHSVARHFPDCDFKPPHLPFGPAGPRRERVLTPDEIWALYTVLSHPGNLPREYFQIQQARKHYGADLFLLLLLTGARQGEIVSLEWPAVSFVFNTFTLDAPKTNDRRTLPLTPLLRSIFERRKQEYPAKPFPKHLAASRYKLFEKVGTRAKVPYGQNVPNGWTLHTLRHTAISIMLRAGADLLSVQQVVGHSNPGFGTTYIYAHASQQSMLNALMKLEEFWLNLCREKDGTGRKKVVKIADNK